MPAPPIVIGTEFLHTSVMNADTTLLQVWVTVTTGTPAAPGRFTVRWDNGSNRAARIVLRRTGFADVNVTVPPGAGSFDAGNRLYADWRTVNVIPASRVRPPKP
jgi:hypothetical protein